MPLDISWQVLRQIVHEWAGASADLAEVKSLEGGSVSNTIAVTTTLTAPVDKDTILDGGGKVTLDGGNSVRILSAVNGNYRVNMRTLTLQRLAFKNGKAPGGGYVPPSTTNPKCAYGYREGGGGAVLIRDIKAAEAAKKAAEEAKAQAEIDRRHQKAIEEAASKLKAAEAAFEAERAKRGPGQQGQ